MAAPEIKRIVKETLSYIDEHQLSPGDRLPSERDLASLLTVGRGAVREALSVLEAVRLVERRPQSGLYLRDRSREGSIEAMVLCADFGIPLTERQVSDAVEMRRILEVQAVGLACVRRHPEDVERLGGVLEESEAEIAAGRSIAELDARFHLAVVEATHNDVFCRVVHSFYLLSRDRREVYFRDAEQCRRSHTQHRDIFAAIEKGDADRGVSILERHLKGVEAFWLSTLGKVGREEELEGAARRRGRR